MSFILKKYAQEVASGKRGKTTTGKPDPCCQLSDFVASCGNFPDRLDDLNYQT